MALRVALPLSLLLPRLLLVPLLARAPLLSVAPVRENTATGALRAQNLVQNAHVAVLLRRAAAGRRKALLPFAFRVVNRLVLCHVVVLFVEGKFGAVG